MQKLTEENITTKSCKQVRDRHLKTPVYREAGLIGYLFVQWKKGVPGVHASQAVYKTSEVRVLYTDKHCCPTDNTFF